MADMTMCNISYCKMIPFCVRHRTNTESNPHYQSYLVDPQKDCKESEYQFYIKPERK